VSYLQRRDFIQRALMATAGGAAFGLLPAKLALAQNALAGGTLLRGTGPNDYKALVCIYLYGGNDCFNMVIPRDAAGYLDYSNLRKGNNGVGDPSNLAVPQANILPLNPSVAPLGGGQFGLHPAMTGLKTMFDAGKAAIVANVGTLVRPTTLNMYQNTPGVLLPAQLFSHSDQSVLWQTPRADATDRTGWGGKLADVFYANSNPGNQTLSMNVSLDGDNVFQSGVNVAPYFMNTYGVEEIGSIQTNPTLNCGGQFEYNRRRCLTFKALQNLATTAAPGHAFERAYVQKTKRSIDTAAQVSVAIAAHPPSAAKFAPFWTANGLVQGPDNVNALPNLAQQLLMIARVIASRVSLSMNRQLFYAAIGGFDTHDTQNADHPDLLKDISQSVSAFYQVLDTLDPTLANNVTAFTASDFGRTLTNNGDGTDHAWGAHHLVFGAAVNGNRIYGQMPSLKPTGALNPDDIDGGRLIPRLSTDQYAATLSKWYGLQDLDRSTIFPNLTYMTSNILSVPGPDLGFMMPA
jgi:uncharacterized protein (DUF1501 family)